MANNMEERSNSSDAVANVEERSNVSEAMANREERNELDKRMQELRKDAFYLANYYFVFQGVIFTAFFSGSSSLKCHYHWIPFTLSLLAGILNLSALLVIAYKYKRLLDKRDEELLRRLSEQRPADSPLRGLIVIAYTSAWRHFFILGCMTPFLAFFSITLFGCWKIPCRGMDFLNIDESKNCIRLCDLNNCIAICQQ